MALVERLEGSRAAANSELRTPSKQTALAARGVRSSKLVARSEEAAEIAEVALVLPLVFMFLLGIVWFGRVFNIYATITQAAQQGAITAARPSCATCGANFPGDDTVANSVIAVLKASGLDENQIILDPAPSPTSCNGNTHACTNTTQNITVCRDVLLNPPSGGTQVPQCGTLVGFHYPFQFYLPFTSLNQQRIVLTAQAQSRMEK